LLGEQCPHCDEKIFPPRDICPRCGGGTLKNNLNVSLENKNELKPIIVEPRVSLEVLN